MPTIEYTREGDGSRIEYEVTYTLTDLGKLDEVTRITLTAMFVLAVGQAFPVFPQGFPAHLSTAFVLDASHNHLAEIIEQIEGEIEGAKVADYERRARLAMENER